jgi:hypothetical protein
MSDRLQELLQQRALLQSHLAWLDREIAAASGQPLSPPPSHRSPELDTPGKNASPAVSPPTRPSSASLAPESDAEEILAQYRQETGSLQTDVRKGCLLYFFGAFLLLGLVLTVFYFFSTRRHRLDSETRPAPPAAPGQH